MTTDTAAPAGAAPTILEAIVRKRCVTAMYNRVVVTLAPHVLFTRHGDLHVDAITLARDGRPPREVKMGTFKLAGLGALALTERPFTASAMPRPGEPKYGDEIVMAVEG